jgi:hypothetical protein
MRKGEIWYGGCGLLLYMKNFWLCGGSMNVIFVFSTLAWTSVPSPSIEPYSNIRSVSTSEHEDVLPLDKECGLSSHQSLCSSGTALLLLCRPLDVLQRLGPPQLDRYSVPLVAYLSRSPVLSLSSRLTDSLKLSPSTASSR